MTHNMLKEIEFDIKYINSVMENIDINLKKYIEENIFPEYELNDKGHNLNHIKFVLNRAFEINKKYNINNNILYTCVCFHDIACHIDRENHEKLSSERAYQDPFLNQFFSSENMIIIKEAIEDHIASSNNIPRNIYGKILSSADRKVEIKNYLISSIFFGITDINKMDKAEAINQSYEHAIKKFGKNGYATNKFYVEDDIYQKFLDDLQYLIDNKDEFIRLANIVFNEVKNGGKNE